MKTIHYVNEKLVTGTDIADAVVAYAQALAQEYTSDTIVIPVVGPGGQVVSSTMLIGPASQLVAVDVPDPLGAEVEDAALVDHLQRRATELAHPIGMAIPSEDLPDLDTNDL